MRRGLACSSPAPAALALLSCIHPSLASPPHLHGTLLGARLRQAALTRALWRWCDGRSALSAAAQQLSLHRLLRHALRPHAAPRRCAAAGGEVGEAASCAAGSSFRFSSGYAPHLAITTAAPPLHLHCTSAAPPLHPTASRCRYAPLRRLLPFAVERGGASLRASLRFEWLDAALSMRLLRVPPPNASAAAAATAAADGSVLGPYGEPVGDVVAEAAPAADGGLRLAAALPPGAAPPARQLSSPSQSHLASQQPCTSTPLLDLPLHLAAISLHRPLCSRARRAAVRQAHRAAPLHALLPCRAPPPPPRAGARRRRRARRRVCG